jgi:hypothetical protein
VVGDTVSDRSAYDHNIIGVRNSPFRKGRTTSTASLAGSCFRLLAQLTQLRNDILDMGVGIGSCQGATPYPGSRYSNLVSIEM